MQFENILKCHPSYIHLICEEDINQCDCLLITDGHDTKRKIFLGKSKNTNEYEVRIFKEKPTDEYIPYGINIKFKRYVANNEFVSFFFNDFLVARNFINAIRHIQS